MGEGKERKKMKSVRDREEKRDMLNELPDFILLHIMNFMETKCAVRTCVLSKRWKNLWKHLTTLSFCSWDDFKTDGGFNFNKFVSRVLSGRDASIPLLNLRWCTCNNRVMMNKVIKYALLHNLHHLDVKTDNSRKMPNSVHPHVFSSSSLTFLKLSYDFYGPPWKLPKSLQLPALKTLILEHVSFTASADGCADPFSTCNLLNTLVLKKCSWHKYARVLFISNSNLSSLNLDDLNTMNTYQRKIMLSTPNLTSLTVNNVFSYQPLPVTSTCNLSCLEEGTIDLTASSVFIGWLQLFTNVKILTLSYDTLRVLKYLSNQPPCFVRLKSLRVIRDPFGRICDEEVDQVVEYLLQNSSMTRDAVLKVLQHPLLNY